MSTWTDTLTMDTMAKERANPPFDVRKVCCCFVTIVVLSFIRVC